MLYFGLFCTNRLLIRAQEWNAICTLLRVSCPVGVESMLRALGVAQETKQVELQILGLAVLQQILTRYREMLLTQLLTLVVQKQFLSRWTNWYIVFFTTVIHNVQCNVRCFLCPCHLKNGGGALSVTSVCACVRPSVIKIWCPLNNFWKTASIQFNLVNWCIISKHRLSSIGVTIH